MHPAELGPGDRQHFAAAFSFIVQEPSGIIDVSRPTSFRSRPADDSASSPSRVVAY
jgi:hypothetical protein